MKVSRDQFLVKSLFLQKVGKNNKHIIWHSLFGYPKIVSDGALRLIDLFKTPRPMNSLLAEYEIDDGSKEGTEVLEQLIESYYLVPVGLNERKLLREKMKEKEKLISAGSLIDYLELRVSQACNFLCPSCIHFNTLRVSIPRKRLEMFMSFEVAKKAVDVCLDILRRHQKKIAEICFGGGEPLLNWPVISQVLDYCREVYRDEFTFQFAIITNASLLTPKMMKKIKAHDVEIAPSLDALKEGNDKVRFTKNGGETFDIIMEAFNLLNAFGYTPRGVTCVLSNDNFSELDNQFIDWAVGREIKEVHIDIDVVNPVEIPVEEVVEKLMKIRKYAKLRGIGVGGFWSRPVENLNDSPLETQVAFCGSARGNNLVVNPSGDIYSCGYRLAPLGNIYHFNSFFSPENKYYRFTRSNFTGVRKECRGCMIEAQCGGGCAVTREFSRATRNPSKIEWMCDFYRLATKKILLEQLQQVES